MKGELFEYNGEMLTHAEIARRTGIHRATLADWYNRTKDMNLAVEGALKSLAQRNISYHGEVLSLKAIADKEGLKFETLKRFYDENNDIDEAVRLAIEAKLKRTGSILYQGKLNSFSAIAKMEDIDYKSLASHYNKTKDIDEAIRLTKEAKIRQNGDIPYNGTVMTISGIANLEGIKHETLKEYYELYNNIDKAVLITKLAQARRREALLRGKKATYEELARQFDMSVIELSEKIDSGSSVEEISKKKKRGVKKEEQIRVDEDSLYRYCLNHSYNYWVILSIIKDFNKTPEDAIKAYVSNGQKMPIKWIYEKYQLLFKHLMLSFGLDSNRIVKIMKDNDCSIKEAIQRLVFISNNQGLKQVEIDWLEELYSFIKDLSPSDYAKAKETFYITEREEKIIQEKHEIIKKIDRQLLLFEFARVLEEWTVSDLLEMMELYEVTYEEKQTIVLDLYAPFKNEVIDPTEDYAKRRAFIRNIILDEGISNDDIMNRNNLSIEEKKEIFKKRQMLVKINVSDLVEGLSGKKHEG